MYRHFALFVASALAIGCAEVEETATTDTAEATPVAFNVDGAPTVEFSVPGMTCSHCAPKVEQALAGQPGVKEVKIKFDEKLAVVAVDETTFDADAAVVELVDEYGFEDTVVAPDES